MSRITPTCEMTSSNLEALGGCSPAGAAAALQAAQLVIIIRVAELLEAYGHRDKHDVVHVQPQKLQSQFFSGPGKIMLYVF